MHDSHDLLYKNYLSMNNNFYLLVNYIQKFNLNFTKNASSLQISISLFFLTIIGNQNTQSVSKIRDFVNVTDGTFFIYSIHR
jgi:hypothetical protein